MAQISRHTPYGLTDPFEAADPLDNLFRGFFRPVQVDKERPQIRLDVTEGGRKCVAT